MPAQRRFVERWRCAGLAICPIVSLVLAHVTVGDFLHGFVEPWFARQADVDAIAAIDAGNGIDQREASRIASAYWTAHQDLICGGPDRPIQAGGWWTTCIHEGVVGERDGGCLRIHARTGAVTSTFARSYKNLDELHERLVLHAW